MSKQTLIICGVVITVVLIGSTVTAYYFGKRAGVKKNLNNKVEAMINNAIDGIKPGLEKALEGAVGKTVDQLKADVQPFLDACKPDDKKDKTAA